MEKLLTAADIAERLQLQPRTAARYMRQMEHLPTPLRVTETAFRRWLESRTICPGATQKARRMRTAEPVTKIPRRPA